VSKTLAFLPYLRVFDAVCRLGTLRGAAEELHLSPSAVSSQLKKLGDLTGITLFARAGRKVILTLPGQEFYQTVSDALRSLTDSVELAGTREAAPSNRKLRVSVPPSIGIAWLTAAIIEFATNRSISDLTLTESIDIEGVDWQTNDLAIVYGRPPFPGKRWELLSEVQLCAVCAPTLLDRVDPWSRDRKLAGLALLHEDDGDQWHQWSMAARVKLLDNVHVKIPSAAHAISAAVQGRGMALLSDVVTRSHLARGSLVRPFSTTQGAVRAYYLVFEIQKGAQSISAELAEWIRGYFSRESAP